MMPWYLQQATVLTTFPGELFGSFELIPQHHVPLDPSSCHAPPTVVPTDPPGTSDLCNTLYDIANSTAPPLTCFTQLPCTSLVCVLNSGGEFYNINIRLLPQDNAVKAYVTLTAPMTGSDYLGVGEGTTMRDYSIQPEGSKLGLVFKANSETLTLEVRYTCSEWIRAFY